jgi:hypothetical protein
MKSDKIQRIFSDEMIRGMRLQNSKNVNNLKTLEPSIGKSLLPLHLYVITNMFSILYKNRNRKKSNLKGGLEKKRYRL